MADNEIRNHLMMNTTQGAGVLAAERAIMIKIQNSDVATAQLSSYQCKHPVAIEEWKAYKAGDDDDEDADEAADEEDNFDLEDAVEFDKVIGETYPDLKGG